MPILLGALASAIRKRFYDNFAGRTNTTGGLGVATDGSQWTAVNGTIQVTSGAATATTTPTSGGAGTTYPMTVVNMPTSDNVIELTGTNEGSSVAVWVQSSTDWWMVDIDSTFNTIPGNTNYAFAQNAYTAYTAPTNYGAYTAPTNYTAYTAPTNYTSSGGGYSIGYNATTNYTTSATYKTNAPGSYAYTGYITSPVTNYTSLPVANPTNYTSSGGGTSYSSSGGGTSYSSSGGGTSYSGGTYYTYASGSNATTYAYNEILRVSKSVASVVSTITSAVISTASAIKSLRVTLSGNTITARAFSDSALVTQLGSDLVYTATGATITTQYGIAVSPSSYNQSAIISTSVNIKRP